MKLGPIEGTKEEITGFFQDNGLNAGDYFQIPEPPIKSVWLVIPAACVVVASGTLTLLHVGMVGDRHPVTFQASLGYGHHRRWMLTAYACCTRCC
jgi:hypothetical protein